MSHKKPMCNSKLFQPSLVKAGTLKKTFDTELILARLGTHSDLFE
jgi:hypothetical protein